MSGVRCKKCGEIVNGAGICRNEDEHKSELAASDCSAYVVGFMFSHMRDCVALIRKQKPAWQRGKLNGIGGKIEPGEYARDAMVREFREETGYDTTPEQWERYVEMSGNNDGGEGRFRVDFFVTVGDLSMLKSMETEKVELVYTKEMHPMRGDVIENLPWLIALALDYLHDGRPGIVIANYP